MGITSSGARARRVAAAAAAAFAVTASSAVAAPPGFLSNGFGTTGVGVTVTDVGQANNVGALKDLDVDPDGRLVSGGFEEGFGIAVTRHTRTGALDPSFSGDGVATIDADLLGGTAVDDIPDPFSVEWGGLVVDDGGRTYVQVAYADAGQYHDVVVRLTAAGEVDTTFDGDGVSTQAYVSTGLDPASTAGIDLAPGGGVVTAVAFDLGGTGRVAARTISEAGVSGAPVETTVADPTPRVTDLVTDLGTGRIYVLGNLQDDAARTADVLALSSGLAAQFTAAVPGLGQVLTDRIAVAPGGGVAVSGSAVNGGAGFVARLDATGAPVTGFDGDGVVLMPSPISGVPVDAASSWAGLAFDGEDLVVVGEFTSGLVPYLAAARYNADGSLDGGLDPAGVVALSAVEEGATVLPLGSSGPQLGGPPVALTSDGVAVAGARVVRNGKVRFALVGLGPDLVAPPAGGGGGTTPPAGGGGPAPGAVSLQLLNTGVERKMPDLLRAPYAGLGTAALSARLNAEGLPVTLRVARLTKAAAQRISAQARPGRAVRQVPAAGTTVRGSALTPVIVELAAWDPVLDVKGRPRCAPDAVVTRQGRDPLTLAEALKGAEFAPGARVEGAANELLDRFACDVEVNFAFSARATRTTVTAVRFARTSRKPLRYEAILTVTRPRSDTDFMVTYSEGDGITRSNRVPLGADAKLTRNVGNELTVAVRETATGAVADNALVEVFGPDGEVAARARANLRGVAVLDFVPRRAGSYDVYVSRGRYNAPTREEVRQEYLMSLGSVVRRQAFTSVGGSRYIRRGSGFVRAASAAQLSAAQAVTLTVLRQSLAALANALATQIAQANRLSETERADIARLYGLLLGVPPETTAGLVAASRDAGFRPAIATASGGVVTPALRPAQTGLARLPGVNASGVVVGRAEGVSIGRGDGVLINDNGTVIAPDGQPMGTQRLIANDGAGLISDHGGGIVSNHSGAIISNDGGGIISNDGGGLIANDGTTFVPTSRLVSDNGGGIISNDGGGFSPLARGTSMMSARGG
ncbi:hypothetical protein GKE82_12820 [Conexibacter sp. W3-3-2]|uniref:hypothetical protein n=1 Tax=Conexibacter sp. W3-3-2 TaxID=2675227 RepID=UPI0012BA209E|nr:hypothetical protein [Conexibacter sp. W3-3-2]MTD45150.1 hypothetical protein [Conexibacter sp. W3-3-2]